MSHQEDALLMAWAKAHSGVYAMTKLAPDDQAVRDAADKAWSAIQRVDDAVKAALAKTLPSADSGEK